jgi:hypothetical protein
VCILSIYLIFWKKKLGIPVNTCAPWCLWPWYDIFVLREENGLMEMESHNSPEIFWNLTLNLHASRDITLCLQSFQNITLSTWTLSIWEFSATSLDFRILFFILILLLQTIWIDDFALAFRVVYTHAIKKDGGYTHATKKFADTCMPCTELSFTRVPFHWHSVRI